MAVELQTEYVPDWIRNPATLDPPKGIDSFIEKSNNYFAECVETLTRPTITGYALAVGLPGPTSLIRLGQRIPELRYVISRCMTAIANGYENMVGNGNSAGPMFMLKNIPDFDPDEPDGAPPIQFFNDRKEVLLQTEVIGAAYSGEGNEGEDPVEAYMRLIKREGYMPPDEREKKARREKYTYTPTHQTALTILTEGWHDAT